MIHALESLVVQGCSRGLVRSCTIGVQAGTPGGSCCCRNCVKPVQGQGYRKRIRGQGPRKLLNVADEIPCSGQSKKRMSLSATYLSPHM